MEIDDTVTERKSLSEFPDLNIADMAEVAERCGLVCDDSKLDKMLEGLDQPAIRKAAMKVGKDMPEQIEAAYQEASRQIKKRKLLRNR